MIKTQEFIKKASKIHSSRYDYSKSVYIKASDKLIIICEDHGEFLQSPSKHLSGRGCPLCAKEKRASSRRDSREDFILKAKKTHGDFYDYSLVDYKNSLIDVEVGCPVHGSFYQSPTNHKRGAGCPACHGGVEYNIQTFIEKSKSIHGDFYSYHKAEYTSSQEKIAIVCPTHGTFHQTPAVHLRGGGCPACAKVKRIDTMRTNFGDNYIEEVQKKIKATNIERHGVPYPLCKESIREKAKASYQSVNGDRTCRTVHISDLSYNVLNDRDKLEQMYKTDGVIETAKILGVHFKTVYTYMERCGIEVDPDSNRSFGEKSIQRLLEEKNIEVDINNRSILDGKEIDIFLPSHNVGIEFNGIHWHSEKFKEKYYHQKKSLDAMEKGIQLIHVWEDDWNDDARRKIIMSKILNKCGISDRSVYARKTSVQKISPKEAREFLDIHHIQGKTSASIWIGLRDQEGNLVACMGMKAQKDRMTWDLVRFASACTVVGGFSKCLKFFQRNYEWGTIFTFADLDYSHGDMYEKTGFVRVRVTSPGMYYVKGDKRLRREKFMKHKLIDVLDSYDPNLTEKENMWNNGYVRLYNSGAIRYETYS